MIKLKLVHDESADIYPDKLMRKVATDLINKASKSEETVIFDFEQCLFLTAIMTVLTETELLRPDEVVLITHDVFDNEVEEHFEEDYRLRFSMIPDYYTEFRKILMGF